MLGLASRQLCESYSSTKTAEFPHFTSEVRRELIRQQLKETLEKSDAQLAKGLGVSDKTVAKQRQDMESTSEIPKLGTRVGADGKERRRPVSVYNPTRREEKAIKNPAVVARMAEKGKTGCSISGLIIFLKIRATGNR